MFKSALYFSLFLMLCCFNASLAQAGDDLDPTGYWQPENKRSIIKIEKCGDTLCATIHWIIKDGLLTDSKNPDPQLRGRPMCGLQLFSGFKNHAKNKKVWDGGSIYKADEGDTYKSTLSVISKDKLYLRGYVGIPLFGKTQYWTRTNPENYPACVPVKSDKKN